MHLIGAWFPVSLVAIVLLPLGGARSPVVSGMVTLVISVMFLAAVGRAVASFGYARAQHELFAGVQMPAVLALPALVALQAIVQLLIGYSPAAPILTMQSAFYLMALSMFFVMSRSAAGQRKSFEIVLVGLVVIGTAEGIYGLLNLLQGNEHILFIYDRPIHVESATGTFYSRNQFAFLLEMTLPLGLGLAARFSHRERGATGFENSEARSRFVLLCTAATIMIIALIFSRSRMGMMSLLVATASVHLVNALVRPDAGITVAQRGRIPELVIMGIAVLGVAAVIGIEPVLERFFNIQRDLEEGRGPLWQATVALALDHPIFGSGWGSFEALIPAYRARPSGQYFDHAHNEYLEIFAETGLIGLAIVVWLLARFAIALVTALRRELTSSQRTIIVALGVAIASVLFHSVADFGLRVPAIALMFLAVIALFSRATSSPETLSRNVRSRSHFRHRV